MKTSPARVHQEQNVGCYIAVCLSLLIHNTRTRSLSSLNAYFKVRRHYSQLVYRVLRLLTIGTLI